MTEIDGYKRLHALTVKAGEHQDTINDLRARVRVQQEALKHTQEEIARLAEDLDIAGDDEDYLEEGVEEDLG